MSGEVGIQVRPVSVQRIERVQPRMGMTVSLPFVRWASVRA